MNLTHTQSTNGRIAKMFGTWVFGSRTPKPWPCAAGKKTIGCTHCMHGQSSTASCGQPSLLNQQSPQAQLKSNWGAHGIDGDKDPRVKHVFVLVNLRRQQLVSQNVLPLQSSSALQGPKFFTQNRNSFPPGQTVQKKSSQFLCPFLFCAFDSSLNQNWIQIG